MQTARVATPLDIIPLIKECMKTSFLKDIHFSRIYPNVPVTGPTIVWRLKRRVLGKEGKETKKERIRGTDIQGDDSCVTLWGQWTTAVFQFDLFHSSDDEVDDLMRKFELFIREIRGTLGLCGVESFIFTEQLEDYALPTPREIPQRSIRYTATMTTIYPVYNTRVHQIALSIAAGEDTETMEITRSSGKTDIIAARTDQIISIGNTAGSTDYIAGVDYDLVDTGEHTATIQWLPHGLHPEGDSIYYIKYCALADPVSFLLS